VPVSNLCEFGHIIVGKSNLHFPRRRLNNKKSNIERIYRKKFYGILAKLLQIDSKSWKARPICDLY